MTRKPVKTCSCCRAGFTLEDFMRDTRLEPVGMCLDDDYPDLNSYYFTHNIDGCGTTFCVDVRAFRDYIDEPIPERIMTGGDGCHGHCTSVHDLTVCRNECQYAPYRRLLLRMREKLAYDSGADFEQKSNGAQLR